MCKNIGKIIGICIIAFSIGIIIWAITTPIEQVDNRGGVITVSIEPKESTSPQSFLDQLKPPPDVDEFIENGLIMTVDEYSDSYNSLKPEQKELVPTPKEYAEIIEETRKYQDEIIKIQNRIRKKMGIYDM